MCGLIRISRAIDYSLLPPNMSSIKVYDGVTGDYIRDFVSIENNGGLRGPGLMTFIHTDQVTLNYLGTSAQLAASTAVPEPASFGLCGMGGLVLTLMCVKKRRTNRKTLGR